MSQHFFSQDNLRILYGWDEPLQYYFLVITETDQNSFERRDVFSNLDLPNPAMTIAQIKDTLHTFKIKYPDDLEDSLIQDRLNQTDDDEND